MRITSTLSLITTTLLIQHVVLGQGGSFEKVVPAPLFPIEGMARAAQLASDQGACVFVSNPLIGSLGDADVLLLRVNGDGDIIQNLVVGDIGGQGYHDVAKEVVQVNKHYFVAGYTRAIDTSAAHTYTAFLVKVDTALNFIWQRNYILPGQEIYAEAMTPVGANEMLIAGKIYDGNNFNGFVMRTDTAGMPVWIKQYEMPMGETIECVRPLSNGHILLSGSMIFGFELVLPFMCKLDADGDFLWGKYYNYPPGIVERSSFQFLHVTSMDDIQLAGHTDKFGAGATDLYVVNVDSSGTVNWARTYGGTQFDEPNMVQFDNAANELVMVGSSGSFAAQGSPFPMAMRIAPNSGLLLNAALYSDTSVYQPARFYHSARVSADKRLLMGSRDLPADDLSLVGTDNDLANQCEYHPVTPAVGLQITGTGDFDAIVTVPAPVVNDVALALGSFNEGTMLCATTTGIVPIKGQEEQLELLPNTGHGSFVLRCPKRFPARTVDVLDLQGRLIYTSSAVPQVDLPNGTAAGTYVVRVSSADGSSLQAIYELR
jgi:hypothetical protein